MSLRPIIGSLTTHRHLFFLLAAFAPLALPQSVDSILHLDQTPPAALAADPQGNLLVATTQPSVAVSRYTPQGGLIETLPAPALTAVTLLATDPQGAIYAGNALTLLRLNSSWTPQLPSDSFALNAIAFDPQSNPVLLLTDRSQLPNVFARVLKLDHATGQQIAAFDLPTAAYPSAIAIDPTGAVYVTGVANNLEGFAAKLDPSLQAQIYFTPLDPASPHSIAVDSGGNAYIAETPLEVPVTVGPPNGGSIIAFGASAVLKLNPTGAIAATNSGGGTYIALTNSGDLVVAGGTYSPTGAFQVTCGPRTGLPGLSIATLDAATLQPRASAFLAQQSAAASALLPDGSLYVATASARILRANPSSQSSPVACITNGASYLVESSIEPGELLTIFGTGLGSDPLTIYDESQQLPFAANETEVRIGGYAAPLLAVSSTQINTVVPYELTAAANLQATIEISRNDRVIYSWPMTLAQRNPAPLLAFNPQGALDFYRASEPQNLFATYPVPLAAVRNADGTMNSSTNPAHLGDTVTLYATGFGQLSPAPIDGAPGATPPQSPINPAIGVITPYGALAPPAVATVPGRTNAVLQLQSTIPTTFPPGPLPFVIGPPNSAYTNFLYLTR